MCSYKVGSVLMCTCQGSSKDSSTCDFVIYRYRIQTYIEHLVDHGVTTELQ